MQCCVPFCSNTSDNASTSEGTGITFHKLPSEENIRAAWLRALGIQDHHLPDPAVVCSQHFVDEDFYKTNSCVREIRSDAIPSTVQIKSESAVGDVATVMLKCEDSSDFMLNADNSELVHEDDNQRDNSNNDCVTKHEYADVSIKLEPMDEEDTFPTVTEHMVEIEISIKSESNLFECALCYADFVQEDAYKEHMNMHTTTANKTGSQRLNDAPPPAAGCAQATVAPLSARLAAKYNKMKATEEAAATWRSQQINQLSQGNTKTNCVVQLCDIFKKPKKTVLNNTPKVKTNIGAKIFYSCDTCDYKTAYKNYLSRHKRTHTGEKPYSCEICNFATADKSHLITHMRTHTGEKPYCCDICDYKCVRKSNLIRHKKTHTGEKPYSCELCNFTTADKSNLLTHNRTHTGEKPYCCEICNYKCIRKNNLIRHKKTHTGEKPYSCEICNFRTPDENILARHKETHTSDKSYCCEFCNYKCVRKSNLNRHKRTHTGVKPFSCEMCDYRTVWKSNLINHRKTHTGENPYS